jgi:hypothetical protein
MTKGQRRFKASKCSGGCVSRKFRNHARLAIATSNKKDKLREWN